MPPFFLAAIRDTKTKKRFGGTPGSRKRGRTLSGLHKRGEEAVDDAPRPS